MTERVTHLFNRIAPPLSRRTRHEPPADAPALWLARDRVDGATRAARRLFGSAVSPGAPLSVLMRALAHDDAQFERAVHRLVRHGEPFRRRARLQDDRVYDVEGAPVGAVCVVMLRDVHEEAQALDRAQAAQRRAEAEATMLRAALDATPTPVWRESENGALLWSNAAAQALDRVDPDARAAARAHARRPSNGEDASAGFLVLGASGGPSGDEAGRDIAAGGSLGAGDRGAARPNGPVGRGAGDDARRYLEALTQVLANLRVGLAIYDGDRRLILSNPAMAEIFGADPDWLAGGPGLRETLDRLREARRLPEQADYPAWRATLFTLFDDPGRARYEDVWELPDGRGIHVVARPHPLGGVAFMFEDFTESMALQRWRSTAVEVRRATLDMLDEGVVVFGPDGRTRIANPACRRIWGLDEAAQAQDETGPPGHVADFAAACAAAVGGADALWARIRAAVSEGAGRASWSGRVDLADGRILEARVAPMPDGSTLAAFTDITASARVAAALRERADALEASATMRDALVDQLSHRLRTPLNALFGFAQMLRSGRAGALSGQQGAYVENIENAARLMLEGVEHLADLISTEVAPGRPQSARDGAPPEAASQDRASAGS